MRVMHISEVDYGGVMTHLSRVVPQLASRGVHNILVLPARTEEQDNSGTGLRTIEGAGVRVVRIPMSRRPSIAAPRVLQRLRSLIGYARPDIIHTHSTVAGFWGRFAVPPRLGIASVHSPHAFAIHRYKDLARRRLAVFAERMLCRRTDGYILVSHDESRIARDVYRLPAEKRFVIPNGLPEDFRDSLLPAGRARDRLQLGGDKPTVLFAGRLDYQKGADVLARAVPLLRAPIRVAVAGTGRLEPSLRRWRRSDNGPGTVLFLGYVPHIATCLRAFDALVLPSRYEGLPYILLESLAAGLKVVASDVTGTRLETPFGDPATYVPPEDPPALARAIESTVGRSRSQREETVGEHPAIPAPYRLETQVSSMLALYQSLAGSL